MGIFHTVVAELGALQCKFFTLPKEVIYMIVPWRAMTSEFQMYYG
jgi:hypothetical protein